jgi:cell division septation protein DedD
MRDLQHWKDKVELSLDGRQVFFLFFGGAILACMLFALGVMTGRRLEARAIALEAPAAEDPLAALDQLGDLEDEDLTYHRALTRSDAHPRAAKEARETKEAKGQDGKDSAKDNDTVAVAKPVPASPKAPVAPAPPKPTVAAAPVKLPPPPKPAPVKPAVHAAVESPEPRAKPELKGDGKEHPEAGQAHFTLQLSAFTAKKDADELVHRVQAAGYRPFVVASDVPGKGVLFRVRVGDYPTKDAAIAEKNAVESKLKVAAYLAKL